MINVRSEGLIDNLSNFTYHILGCGAIGSSAAIQLTRIGAKELILYDLDKVEEFVGNQLKESNSDIFLFTKSYITLYFKL